MNLGSGGNRTGRPTAKSNPLYKYFEVSDKRTITLSFKQIEGIIGKPLGETAERREFWLQHEKGRLNCCWLDNDYFVKKVSTAGRKSVTFRKYSFAGETGRVELPDLLMHGEVPMRLKYRIESMIRHEFEQCGLATD